MLAEAREHYADALLAHQGIKKNVNLFLENMWRMGRALSQIKNIVGRGAWLPWLENHFPELGENPETRRRNAWRCIYLFEKNPNVRNSARLGFSEESVRKVMWGYLPQKQRPALPGDEPIKPAPHQLTFVNHYFKFRRQMKIGRVKPDVARMREDLAPVITDLVELLGSDWLAKFL
ncbi:MAG TPA: hypothetical protein VG733_02610 [Chthoniobacteraceae bacterium]|nr:hypothetical protein [Chthoniobacteraceae bacterium]